MSGDYVGGPGEVAGDKEISITRVNRVELAILEYEPDGLRQARPARVR